MPTEDLVSVTRLSAWHVNVAWPRKAVQRARTDHAPRHAVLGPRTGSLSVAVSSPEVSFQAVHRGPPILVLQQSEPGPPLCVSTELRRLHLSTIGVRSAAMGETLLDVA